MRLKAIFAVIPAVILAYAAGNIHAQVAPQATVGGRPIGISVGFSNYDLDYGPSRRMEGVVLRGGVGIFHGLGVDVNARTIFMNTPSRLTRMQQNTFLAGVYYEAPRIWRIRPFARAAGGLGTIEFPSKNPDYTRDSYTVYAPSGGIEYPIAANVFARAEYEYQFWKDYQGPKYLNPSGWTVGATYYLRGRQVRPHSLD